MSAADLAAVDELISIVAAERRRDDFWVTDTRPIGGDYYGDGRPFVVVVQADSDRTDTQIQRLAEEFGWVPKTTVDLVAMCNQPVDHKILADLAAALGERLHGVVDLCGWLPMSVTPGVAAIEYETDGGTATYFVVSTDALRRWRGHPEFHMVK